MNARFAAALFFAATISALLSAAELKDVKSVYLYPMVGGLDQHLANVLTQDHLFRVVTDPKLADALFTDQLDKQFEYRVDHLKHDPVAPPPPPPQTAPSAAAPSESEPHGSSFSRGKGTIFLVDAKSRQVLWSDYRQAKNTSARELEKTAKRLAMNITRTLTPPASTK